MILKTRMLGQTYEFKDVKDVLAKASEKKSGDELAGVGAESALERIAAKEVLAQLTVADLTEHPVVPYEEDAVTWITIIQEKQCVIFRMISMKRSTARSGIERSRRCGSGFSVTPQTAGR